MSILKVDTVEDHFADDKPRLKKGKDALDSGHLMECRVDRTLGLLFGIVQASERTKSYTVKAFFTPNKISHAECSCPIGEHGQCHHIAAVLHYASTSISCTETECQWSFKTKAGHGNEGLPIDVFYPPKKPDYQAIPGPLAPDELKEARDKLKSCDGAALAMKWILDPEPTEENKDVQDSNNNNEDHINQSEVIQCVPLVEDVIRSEGFETCDDKLQYFRDFFSLSQADIESIAEATKDQNDSALWHSIRRHRVTASVFGKAINASSNKRSCKILFKLVSGTGQSLDGIKSIDWGRTHEPVAVKKFCDNFPVKVVSKTGIWLDQYGLTGASPDRLCSSDEILEVKCMHFLRNATSLKEELAKEKFQKCFISVDKDGDIVMNINHEYYHQVQGQLYLTNRTKCHFIIWIPKDMLVVTIDKQADWAGKYMPCIYRFFFQQICTSFLQ